MRIPTAASAAHLAISALFASAAPVLLAACPAPPSALAKAQQTAQEFNLDARFGRTEIVMDRVSAAERDEYSLHHRGWGSDVRVADVELAGMKPQGEHEVDVIVKVAWYRPTQQELKQTTLKQRWHDKADDWVLVGEQRLDGDIGLLGEPIVFEAPTAARPPAQFPTIRLSGSTTQ